jgi:hypothetical protein
MNLKKIGKVFTSKFVGTGRSSYEERNYGAAVSQSLRKKLAQNKDTATLHTPRHLDHGIWLLPPRTTAVIGNAHAPQQQVTCVLWTTVYACVAGTHAHDQCSRIMNNAHAGLRSRVHRAGAVTWSWIILWEVRRSFVGSWWIYIVYEEPAVSGRSNTQVKYSHVEYALCVTLYTDE